ncbi:monocarboxylate transporter 13-like [Rhopilema esculentum]|uniref:monocarboxylate transporter 13-like n=1 Tax=Rhopilema esculentum TaxID=499914 RepID=UPI0031DC9F1E|eukprot:gene12689-3402_t
MEEEYDGNECKKSRCYAWFICGVSFTVQFMAMSFFGSFGPLYVELLRVFKEGDAKTAWVASISFSICFLVSPITYRIDERIGQRKTMMIGSVLFGLGLFLSSFANSLSLLFVTIGVLVAIGHSFCQAASMFVLPHFFGNNYAMPLGIALSGASTGALALSSLKELIFRKFAFKMGMQILSGTALILLLCGITFKPPKAKTLKSENSRRRDSIDERYPPLQKNKAFQLLLLASFVYHSVYLVTYVHLTRLAGDLGISDTKAALLPGFVAIMESVGKVCAGKFISLFDSKCLTLYQSSWLGMAISTFLCPLATGFTGLALYAVGWGFCVGAAAGSCVPVIRYLVGNRNVIRAYSIFLMCFSPAVLAGPPLAGWLREKTHSYDVALYVTGTNFAVASAMIFLVKLFDRMQRKTYFDQPNPFNVGEDDAESCEEKDPSDADKKSIVNTEIDFNLIHQDTKKEKNDRHEDLIEEFHCNLERSQGKKLLPAKETDL